MELLPASTASSHRTGNRKLERDVDRALLGVLSPSLNALFSSSFEAVARQLACGLPGGTSTCSTGEGKLWAMEALRLLSVPIRSDRLAAACATARRTRNLTRATRLLHRTRTRAAVVGVHLKYAFCQPPQQPPEEVCQPAYFPSANVSLLWGRRCQRTFLRPLMPENGSRFAPLTSNSWLLHTLVQYGVA